MIPASYLADPNSRLLFSLFLATAMSISAMPVIAKILVDLDLTKRNIGLVILSAGVVDDTVGWLILSLIAGAATHGAVRVTDLGLTIVALTVFILGTIFVLYPILRVTVRVVGERFKAADSDLVLVIVTTFLCAAATEKIGVHPVFGAFIAGVVLHQTPRLRRETVARLESFTFGVLAPIFFGLVGLRVNLWELGGAGMLVTVIAVACVGKLVGCGVGAYWGGLRFWEAASIAVAMNARGAMEIVVATIGLSLGILTPQMFSIIVMVAIVTSFLAPVGLKLTMPRVRLTEDEARRILQSESMGAFDPSKVRVILATGGGPNALAAAPLAFGLANKSDAPVKIVHVVAKRPWWRAPFRRPPAGNVSESIEAMKALATARPPEVSQPSGPGVAAALAEEARRGCDVIVIGSGDGPAIGGPVVEELVGIAPCHVAIMKAPVQPGTYKKILVPVDGSVASRLAVELALRYAEATGAELALGVMTERRPQAAAYTDMSGTHPVSEVRTTSESELQRISVAFRASEVKPSILHLAFDPRSSTVAQALEKGHYDLVVLGAENRADPAPAVLRLRKRAPHPRGADPGAGGRPQPVPADGTPRMTASPRLILVGGGARSGKSRCALARALSLGPKRLFIATAEAGDVEMAARIDRHRVERGATFDTLEEPLALEDAIAGDRDHDVILIDCLTLWLSNLLGKGLPVDEVAARAEGLAVVLAQRRAHVVVVSNEVGLGLVPATPLGRAFRDLSGWAHQQMRRRATSCIWRSWASCCGCGRRPSRW